MSDKKTFITSNFIDYNFIKDLRDLVKKEIINGWNYNLSYQERKELSENDKIVDAMTEQVIEQVKSFGSNYGLHKYAALNQAFSAEFKNVLCGYKNNFLDEYKVPITFVHLGEYTGQSGYNDENFILGMIAQNGDAYYISLENDDLIRTNEDIALIPESEYKNLEEEYGDLNLWGSYGEKYVSGGFAENNLFYIYDEDGHIDIDDLTALFSENPVYISDIMKDKLEEIKVKEGKRLNYVFDKLSAKISEAKEKAKENNSLLDNKSLKTDLFVK